jgi:hypothetical protein
MAYAPLILKRQEGGRSLLGLRARGTSFKKSNARSGEKSYWRGLRLLQTSESKACAYHQGRISIYLFSCIFLAVAVGLSKVLCQMVRVRHYMVCESKDEG